MKSLSEFAKTPELIEIVLDDADIVQEYGEPVVFYIKDFVDINLYFEFYQAQASDRDNLGKIISKLIFDANGNPVLSPGQALPVNLSVSVLGKLNENLGKLRTKPSTSENGNQPA